MTPVEERRSKCVPVLALLEGSALWEHFRSSVSVLNVMEPWICSVIYSWLSTKQISLYIWPEFLFRCGPHYISAQQNPIIQQGHNWDCKHTGVSFISWMTSSM